MDIERKDGYIFFFRNGEISGKMHRFKVVSFPETLLHTEIPKEILNQLNVIESAALENFMVGHTATMKASALWVHLGGIKNITDVANLLRLTEDEKAAVLEELNQARKIFARTFKLSGAKVSA